jgi:hypothetical protein
MGPFGLPGRVEVLIPGYHGPVEALVDPPVPGHQEGATEGEVVVTTPGYVSATSPGG